MKNRLIDLHTHTNYSDGELSPKELIKFAIDNNIGTLAITDHDTISGIKNINKNEFNDINIINGIELTAKVLKGRMHILGYDIDINNTILNNNMRKLKNNSMQATLSIMEQIKRDYNIIFDYEDIIELINSNHNLGRPDLAKLCVKYGYANNTQDAFDKYLIEAYDKTRKVGKGLPYQECLELIKISNGISVLAHPKTLELDEKEFLILIKEMISYGLRGIEAYHSMYTEEDIKYYTSIANKYDLLISGGSDYHGPVLKPNIKIGRGINNNLKIKKLTLLDELNKKKEY